MKGSEYAMRVAAFTLPAAHGGGGSHSSQDNDEQVASLPWRKVPLEHEVARV